MSLLSRLSNIVSDIVSLMRRYIIKDISLELIITYILYRYLGLGPRIISLRKGIKCIINKNFYCPFKDVWISREYEKYEKFRPRKGDVVLDIGSHVGYYTLRALSLGAKLIVAIEPNPINYHFLKINVGMNKKHDSNVVILPIACSDKKGSTIFNAVLSGDTGSSSMVESLIENNPSVKNVKKIIVLTTPVDYIIEKLGITKVDIVKIDVEGSEVQVLKGMENGIKNGTYKKLILEVPVENLRNVVSELLRLSKMKKLNIEGVYLKRYMAGIVLYISITD